MAASCWTKRLFPFTGTGSTEGVVITLGFWTLVRCGERTGGHPLGGQGWQGGGCERCPTTHVCGSGDREWAVHKKDMAQTRRTEPAARSHGQGYGRQPPPCAPRVSGSVSHPRGIMADQTHIVSCRDGGLAFFCGVSHSSPLRALPGLGFHPVQWTRCPVIRPWPQPLSLNPRLQADGAPSGFLRRPRREGTQHQTGRLRLEMRTPPS